MQHRKTLLIALFSVIAFCAAAQQTPPLNATWRDSARLYIKQLKEGAIVVRLHSKSLAIEKLKAMGNNEYAKTIATNQREENKKIVKAFRNEFDFCKIYFFMADSTDALLKGKRSGFFLNDSLQIDPAISVSENFFMIAEKGSVSLYQKYDRTQPDLNYTERSYVNETLILLDQNLRPLKSPFPRYARELFTSSKTYWKEKVQILNAKLLFFYKRSV